MDMSDDKKIEEVIERVSAYDIRSQKLYPEPTLQIKHSRRAAILLPITIKHGEVFVLLTKRSKDLRSHPSAVSFPGGMRDEIDKTDIDAALREAEEEIGLPPSVVNVIGILTLGFILPKTVVYPVVGIIPEDFLPDCNPSEVEYAFYVPLKIFVEEGNILEESSIFDGVSYWYRILRHTHEHLTDEIYGFTCDFCLFLAAIVFGSVGKEQEETLADEMKNQLEITLQFMCSTSADSKL